MNIIDCDIHQTWTDPEEINRRLPLAMRRLGYALPGGNWSSPIGVNREDSRPPEGGPPGSSPGWMKKQWLEPHDISHAILTGAGALSLGIHANVDYATALARAYNDALLETWLAEDDCFLGSVLVAPQDPAAAAAEIRRVGGEKKMVQVLLCSATRVPYGQRQYWPIYEAACEMGLPVAIHPGSEGKGIANGFIAGPPSTYLEWHTNLPQNAMGQLVSLLCEGVFEHFPDLKFVCIETGLAWIPGVLWPLDKNWKALRATTPWLRRAPSEYVLDHVRFTTQPVEEPEKDTHLLALFEMIHAEKTLMFSSDYPHWDNDDPFRAFPALPEELRARILWENAAALYGISAPATVAA